MRTPVIALRVLGVMVGFGGGLEVLLIMAMRAVVLGEAGKATGPPTRGVRPVPGVRPVRGVRPVLGVRPVRKLVGSNWED